MTLGEAIILGVVQGLSEFLPVSSSAHLVLVEHWLGITSADLVFEVAVHAGTLLAVIWFFRSRLLEYAQTAIGRGDASRTTATRREILWLVIGTIPAVVVGLEFKDEIEATFSDPFQTAIQLLLTGVLLLSLRFRKPGDKEVGPSSSWWIGVAQAISILPGISRSGATICTGLWMGIRPAVAAEFSFLLSIPAVGGAIVLMLPDAWGSGKLGMPHLVGALVAALTGYVALRLVFAFLRSGRFALFGVYCIIIGALAIYLLR